MCGRFTLTSPAQIIAETFGVEPPAGLQERYNICPGQAIATVFRESEERSNHLGWMRWGLIPSWMKEAPRDARMINARSETAAEKPSFRSSFRNKRCLVPADGFFEWRAEAGGKQPYLIRSTSGRPFAIAGLWSRWQRGDEPELRSCALLTTTPNPVMQPIHDRMPVLLAPDDWDRWLDPANDEVDALQSVLRPAPVEGMEAFPVSRRVNSPKMDDPDCLTPEAPRTLFDL